MRPFIQHSKHSNETIKNFTNLIQSKQLIIKNKSIDILMPEISESIDEFPDDVENINVAVEEKVEKPFANSITKTSIFTQNKNEKNNIDRKPLTILKQYFNRENTETNIKNKTIPFTFSATTTINNINTKKTTNHPITKKITTTMKMIKTTKKNFRKFNDYYSMYYDA